MHRHYVPSYICHCKGRAQFHQHPRPSRLPFVELASIDKVHIKTSGNDPVGAVTEAHICMTGRIIPAVVTEDSSDGTSLRMWLESKSLCVSADDMSMFFDRALRGKRIAVSCFPLLAEKYYRDTISGLLLTSSSGPWTYQRIGTFVFCLGPKLWLS